MDRSYLRVGAPVVTARDVPQGGLAGTGITGELASNRRAGSEGTVQGFIREHEGDVWTVEHRDGSRGAYHVDELVIPKEVCMPGGFR